MNGGKSLSPLLPVPRKLKLVDCPESYRLSGLERLPAADRTKILQMLTSAPVDHYLRVSALALSTKTPKVAPIAYVRPQLTMVV